GRRAQRQRFDQEVLSRAVNVGVVGGKAKRADSDLSMLAGSSSPPVARRTGLLRAICQPYRAHKEAPHFLKNNPMHSSQSLVPALFRMESSLRRGITGFHDDGFDFAGAVAAESRGVVIFPGFETGDALLERRKFDHHETVEPVGTFQDLEAPAAGQHL